MTEVEKKDAPEEAAEEEKEEESAAPANEDSPKAPADDAEEKTDDLIFDTLWGRVLEAWDDDKPHGALVEYAVRAQKLPELAGKYKSLTTDPDKKIKAQKRLDGVVMAATQLLFSMKTPPPPKSNKALNLIAAVIAIAAVAFLAYKILASRPQ